MFWDEGFTRTMVDKTGVLVFVGTGVNVFVAVSVGQDPGHGVDVFVGVELCVGVLVGVSVGVEVAVGQIPVQGPTVREPPTDELAITEPRMPVIVTSSRSSADTPSSSAENDTVARMPLPFAPAGELPSVTHVNWTLPTVKTGDRHCTVRPVLPIMPPATAFVAVIRKGS
jgi:hypothetical protein